jgi:anaerobic magnesium-protoporphyrin IX monomethyl ester cyclase
MNVVLADLRGRGGFVSKDTVAGGYGSRFIPFTRVTRVVTTLKARFHDVPSVQMGYLAALLARWGHTVKFTRGEPVQGDVALILSSLVDYKQETEWADAARARGMRVGFVGLTASKMPQLFKDHADFIINGEPEEAVQRMARGEKLEGTVHSPDIADLDSLPFPRWDLVTERQPGGGLRVSPTGARPVGGGFSLLASRSCPEFCTYCPHRILSAYRARSVKSIVEELAHLCDQYSRPYVIFRDPLFSQDRDRILELCDEIKSRDLQLRYECETRLDRLDPALLDVMQSAGLRAISFGVESVSPDLLKRVGRRPTPEAHQRLIIEHARKRGIVTAGFFVLGFLEDDWNSIGATIEFATDLAPTFAQFKLLTPYPGTPLYKRMEKHIFETDWEKFDGFTPTYNHPSLSTKEMKFLLGAAYTRFYLRPSYLANLWRIRSESIREWVGRMDEKVAARHTRDERSQMSRPVTC